MSNSFHHQEKPASRQRIPHGVALIASWFLFLTPAMSQNLDTLESPGFSGSEREGASASLTDNYVQTLPNGSEVLIPWFLGILVDYADSEAEYNQLAGKPVPSGVTLPSDAPLVLQQKLEDYLGAPLVLDNLSTIRNLVAEAYSSSRYVVRAMLPPQEVTGGRLRIAVVRARLEDVTIKGDFRSDPERYVREISNVPGEFLDANLNLEDLDWLNRPSQRTAGVVLRAAPGFGTTDLELIINDDNPWAAYTRWDNHNVDILGRDRWTFGVHKRDIAGKDIEVSYQWISDADFDSLNSHYASLIVPIRPARHEFRLAAYFADSMVDTVNGLPGFISSGESWALLSEYRIPLGRKKGWKHEFVAGFDVKSTNSNLEFGQVRVFGAQTEIYQFRFGYEVALSQKDRNTNAYAGFVFSPGGWNNQNDDINFGLSRAGAVADYAFFTAGVDHLEMLGKGWYAVASLDVQAATENLLASEQMALSGPFAVRGFETSLFRGDHGAILSFEVHAPPIAFRGSGFDPFVFLDSAWGESVNPIPGEPSLSIASIGLGLNLQILKFLTGELSYAWQISENGFDDGENGRFDAGLTAIW